MRVVKENRPAPDIEIEDTELDFVWVCGPKWDLYDLAALLGRDQKEVTQVRGDTYWHMEISAQDLRTVLSGYVAKCRDLVNKVTR